MRKGVRLGCLEGLHAATDQYGELEHGTPVGPGDRVRLVGCWPGRMDPVGWSHVRGVVAGIRRSVV